MKRFTFVILGLCLATALLAAGGQGGQTAMPAEKKEMTIAWWGSQNRHDRTIQTIQLYMERHPNVEITYEFAGFRDYWTKMTTMAAGGMLPDIMQLGYPHLPQWQGKDLIVSLDEYIASGAIEVSDVGQSVLDTGKLGDTVYAMPLGINSQAIIIDSEAFESAGVAFPAQNWIWPEFEQVCLKIHEALGIYGIGCGLWNPQLWHTVYMANGQLIYAEDGNSLAYTDDTPLVNHWKMALRLIEAGAHPPRDVEIGDFANCDDPELMPIVPAKGAMAYTWSNVITAMASAAGESRKLTMTHLPRHRKNGPAGNYIKPAMMFAITAHSEAPETAADFINFFTNDIEANKILAAERGVPIAAPVREAIEPLVYQSTIESFKYLGRVTQDNSPIPPNDPPEGRQISNSVYYPQCVDPVAFGKITPEEGAALLRREANKILQEN